MCPRGARPPCSPSRRSPRTDGQVPTRNPKWEDARLLQVLDFLGLDVITQLGSHIDTLESPPPGGGVIPRSVINFSHAAGIAFLDRPLKGIVWCGEPNPITQSG